MQPLSTAGTLDDSHVGRFVGFEGSPMMRLHAVEHSVHGYTTLTLGRHTVTLHDDVTVLVQSEVDGL